MTPSLRVMVGNLAAPPAGTRRTGASVARVTAQRTSDPLGDPTAGPYAGNDTAGLPWPSGPRDAPLPAADPTQLPAAVLDAFGAARGFLPPDEAFALLGAARTALAAHPELPLLEIGTYCGRSSLLVGAAAAAAGTTLFTVDHHRGSEENQPGWQWHDAELVDPVTGRLETLVPLRRSLHAAGLDAAVIPVVGDSGVVGRWWTTPVGFLFLDGNHTEEIAQRDYALFAPHVAAGGYLAVHDCYPEPAEGGRPPWNVYLRARADGWEPVGQHRSLRLLRRGADVRPPAPPAR
jgi:MMP 1-O-methyltransferase